MRAGELFGVKLLHGIEGTMSKMPTSHGFELFTGGMCCPSQGIYIKLEFSGVSEGAFSVSNIENICKTGYLCLFYVQQY